MQKSLNVLLTAQQWEELQGLMNTVNREAVSFGEALLPPLTFMIASINLNDMSLGVYDVDIQVVEAVRIDGQKSIIAARWPSWFDRKMRGRDGI
jgi:hypothetical protein